MAAEHHHHHHRHHAHHEVPPEAQESHETNDAHAAQEEDPPSTGTSPDDERLAEPWEAPSEELLRRWGADWAKRCQEHNAQSRKYARKHTVLSVPAVLLPLIFAPASSVVGSDSVDWCTGAGRDARNTLLSVSFIICSTFSALVAYFRWDGVSQRHLASSRAYHDLVSDVEEILSKGRRHRPEAAVALRSLKNRSDYVFGAAPRLRDQEGLIRSEAEFSSRAETVRSAVMGSGARSSRGSHHRTEISSRA